MLVEIITIGDEILIGQVVDTNSAWIADKLGLIGIRIVQITSVSDTRSHIIHSLNDATSRADIILITGGLGPTRDDITKAALCEYFGTKLVSDTLALNNIEKLFAERGLPVTELNRKQAEVLENCIVIQNHNGTAPAMWIEKSEKIFVSMPGVPFEMKSVMQESVIPMLTQKFQLPVVMHKTVHTIGIGESFLAEKISNWEDSLERYNIKLAYLPAPGVVRLRLSVIGNNKEKLSQLLHLRIRELEEIAGKYIYGYDNDTIEMVVGKLLKDRAKTIATAESCTGGYLAHRVTLIPGSSVYFKGSVVAYSNEIKSGLLGVDAKIIEQHGAVSEEVVRMMAIAANDKFKTDYSLAISGIAGPEGGTEQKPVGTVWIALADKINNTVQAKKFLLGNNRERNIHKAAIFALDMLRKYIVNS